MSWKHTGSTFLAGCDLVTERIDDVYRVTLGGGLKDYGSNAYEARHRLADKLESLIRELRK